MSIRALAIDPGSRFTALVVRDVSADPTAGLVWWDVLDREKSADPSLEAWCWNVALAAEQAAAAHSPMLTGVEEAVAPTAFHAGRMRFTNPRPIIEAASVVGACVAGVSARIVPPSGFGAPVASRRVLEAAYPPGLIGPRETTGAGKGRRQHARAAWDLAAALVTLCSRPSRA